ncbi:MAG TPA: hypothetical protein VKR06_44980 [Ktedonosporobacter sp.]|nr:hypothetical protein [Ktedonosporobacter sp.]
MQERTSGNTLFQTYVARHRLELQDIAAYSGVRYVTVWNIVKNKPVTVAHAEQVRAGVQRMAGVPYDGPIATLPP